ncbi:MAG: class I SAM-dependent methyltransferase [Lachnospiraceae bacterium]|nr:class I SAM-dependent methyltransferase [Lachnospiraceae bacterium]
MKSDYKNWVLKSMVYGLAGGTIVAFAAFLLLGATRAFLQGTPRLICGIIFGIATLVLLFYTVWMAALHRTFDYNGKRKLAKTIIEGTAKYVSLPESGVGLDVRFEEGNAIHLPFDDESFDSVTSNYVYHNISGHDKQKLLLETLRVLKKGGTFAIHDLMSPARYGDMDAFVRELKAEGYEDVRLIDTTDGTFMGKKEASWLGLAGSTLRTGRK